MHQAYVVLQAICRRTDYYLALPAAFLHSLTQPLSKGGVREENVQAEEKKILMLFCCCSCCVSSVWHDAERLTTA